MTAKHDHSDLDLFTKIAEGDEKAFTALFYRYDNRIYPFVLKMVKNPIDADEITQEIFLKIWASRSKLVAVENPEAYIIRMSANLTADTIKKRIGERLLLQRLTQMIDDTENFGTIEKLDLKESSALLQEAVMNLPAQQKQVFELSRNLDLTYEEIAQKLGISKNTVRNHLVAALKSIREVFQKNGHELVLVSALLSGLK